MTITAKQLQKRGLVKPVRPNYERRNLIIINMDTGGTLNRTPPMSLQKTRRKIDDVEYLAAMEELAAGWRDLMSLNARVFEQV